MRIAILSSPDSWYFGDLRRAAAGRHQLDCWTFPQLRAAVGGVEGGRVAAGSANLADYDAVLVRTMPPGSLEQVVFRMNALAQLERLGTLVLNPARSLEVAIDKYLTLTKLEQAGLPVPATLVCQSWQDAMDGFAQLGGRAVVKPIFGGEGRGIARVDDPALAMRAFKMLEQLGAAIYLQQYIPHRGFDFRLLVVGRHVWGVRRASDGDWRTNVSRGASVEPLQVESAWRQLALRAAQAVECPLAGVDLLPAADGTLHLLEVNAVPGWKALGGALSLDVASHVLRLAERLQS